MLPIITHSLKTRLTLLFGVLTLGLIIAFTTYLYYFSSQEIMRSAQRNIDNLTRTTVQVLENHVPTIDLEQIDNTWISDKIEQFRTQFQLSDDIQIQVFSIDEGLLYESEHTHIPLPLTHIYAKTAPIAYASLSLPEHTNEVDVENFLISMLPVNLSNSVNVHLDVVLQQRKDLVLQRLSILQLQRVFVVGVLFAVALVLVYLIARIISQPIVQLTLIAEDIDNIDHTNPFPINTNVYEFKQLAKSLSKMVRTIQAQKLSLLELNVSLEEKVNLCTAALNQVNAELLSLSRHDALTGVQNRLAIDEVLKHDFLQFKRSSLSYTVMLLDVDFFKAVNDQYGHTVGDDVLKIIASTLNSCMRETDFVARYGGEEFLIILPDTQEQSFILAEKLRHVISTLAFPFGQQLTVSIGLSIVNSADNAPEDAVRRADKALYTAKENGRNQSQII